MRGNSWPPESPELEAECRALIEALHQGEASYWEVGLHYNNIVDKQLWKGSYDSARHCFAAHFGDESQSTLTRCGALTRSFPQEVAQRYGRSLLTSLLTYEKLAHLNAAAGDPGNIEISIPRDSGVASKLFRDCERRDLEAAIRHLRSPTPDALPPEDAQVLQRLHEAIEPHATIALSSRHGREGTIAVFAVPLRQIGLLSEVLAQFCKPPPPESADVASPELMQKFAQEFESGMKQWIETLGKVMPAEKDQGKTAK